MARGARAMVMRSWVFIVLLVKFLLKWPALLEPAKLFFHKAPPSQILDLKKELQNLGQFQNDVKTALKGF